jgi:hypothetical protein
MKKFLVLFFVMALTAISFAGKLVLIHLEKETDLKAFDADKNYSVLYTSDRLIVAVVDENHKGEYQVIDNKYGIKGTEYYIAWFHKGFESGYPAQVSKIAEIVIQTNDYLILKNTGGQPIHPPVNGRITHIKSEPVKLPETKFTYNAGSLAYDPEIVQMMSEIDTVIYLQNLQHLQDYGTRNAYTPESVQAQNWLKAQFESYGYTTTLFDFTMPGGPASDNVIATKPGTTYPNEYVVIGAHYDSYSYSGLAPGADDDGTGVCGVMEVARVMATRDFDRTIIFCAFSGEEYGLYGSAAYASWAANQGMNILGYFNIDMCGYRHPGNPILTHMIAPAFAQPLVQFYTDVCALYLPSFLVQPGTLTGGDSDHTSFNNNGYMGIFPFEHSQNYSPYIHTSNDIIGLSVNSLEQAMVFTQAMVANVSTMANWLTPPQNLVAIPMDEAIELTWDILPDADHYNIYKDNNPTPIASTTQNSFEDEDVAYFVTYSYYVTAVYTGSGNESSGSNMVTVTFLPAMAFPFFDDFESGAPYWSFEGAWGLSTAQSSSPAHSITESPNGNYGNNMEISANLYKFSLENAISAQITFKTRYSLEEDYDYTYLEISTNGTTWTELDEFNGTLNNWTDKVYSLEDYLEEPMVLIRFRFESDAWVVEDGMYIDDFEIDVEYIGTTGQTVVSEKNPVITISPNPLTKSAGIEIQTMEAGELILSLYSAQGEMVRTIADKRIEPGTHAFSFSRGNLSQGVYYLVVSHNQYNTVRKLIISN